MRRQGPAAVKGLVAALALVLLSGCGTGGSADRAGASADSGPTDSGPTGAGPSETSSNPPPTATGSATGSVSSGGPSDSPSSAPVPAILDFSGVRVDGAPFEGASLAGSPVVLWFWAPWCPVCKSQVPQVRAAATQYAGRASVVGIGSLDDAAAIAGFAAQAPDVTMLQDPEGDLWRHFGITEQSTFVILDADGHEVDRTSYGEDVDLAATLADLTG